MARNTFEKMAHDLEKNAPKGDDTVDTNVQDEEIKVETVKVAKPKPFCECGCGAQTGGGRFIPGHDAKLKSRLFKIVRGQEEGDMAAAIAELHTRNWWYLLSKPAQPSTHKPKKQTVAEQEDDSFYIAMLAAETDAVWMPEVVERNDPKGAVKRTRKAA